MRSFRAFEVLSRLALLSGLLAVARSQEEGDSVQEVTAVNGGEVDNESDEIAMAAVFFNDLLYVALTTEDVLEGENLGGTGIVIRSFDSSLDKELGAQFGGDGNDTVKAIIEDVHVSTDIVIVGGTFSTETHLFDLDAPTREQDWYIAKLDKDTMEVGASYVNGSRNDDQEATAVATLSDGSFIVAGWTWGNYFEDNAGEDNGDAGDVGYDAWVLKIDNDLDSNDEEFEWTDQFGTVAWDIPVAIVVDDSDNIYVVGNVDDTSNILDEDDEDTLHTMFVYKYDADGVLDWSATTSLGVLSDGTIPYGAVLNEDQDQLYVSGSTDGIIPGYVGNTTNSTELFVMGLDVEDGSTAWVWQSEGNATAFGSGGVVLADDGVSPIVAGIAFGNQFNLSFQYWTSGEGDMIAAKIDIEELEVSKYFVAAAASDLTREEPWAMVKDEDVVDGVYLIGQQDGDFEDEDVEPGLDLNYLVLKVELEELPEEEDDDDSDGRDFPYWYVGVPVFAIGGILFVLAYKCAAASQRAKAKQATMV